MADGKLRRLDGFASTADEDPFKTITPRPSPTDPRIEELLGRASMKLDTLTLTPPEVQETAASLVYHLQPQDQT